MQTSSSTTAHHVCAFAYRSTGKERDAESGLDYFGARYYASNIGRWMSPDWAKTPEGVPYADLSNPQSLNLYGYVGNNPLSRADDDGHDWINVQALAQKAQSYFSSPGGQQMAGGVTKIAVGAGLVGTIAAGDAPGGTMGAVMVVSGTISAVSSIVSGVTDVTGSATHTDVEQAQKGLDSVSNGPALVTTAVTGNPTMGSVVGTLSDAGQLGAKPMEALKNPATMADAAKTLSSTVDLVKSAAGAVVRALVPTPAPPPASCRSAEECK